MQQVSLCSLPPNHKYPGLPLNLADCPAPSQPPDSRLARLEGDVAVDAARPPAVTDYRMGIHN